MAAPQIARRFFVTGTVQGVGFRYFTQDEAERLGIKVSDEEVRQRIFAMPAFQENGGFIGEARYQQLLRMQRPPMVASEFEDNVRRGLAVEKLRGSLTDWLSVNDKDLEKEYRRRNDKVKLSVVSFTADSFRTQVSASDAEVTSYFDAHKNDFKIPEKRKIRFLLIDIDALRAKIVVPEADVKRAYDENIEQYSTPEQIRASHILLKTEGKDDAAVKARIEDILKQAKGGADFGEAAKGLAAAGGAEEESRLHGSFSRKGAKAQRNFIVNNAAVFFISFPLRRVIILRCWRNEADSSTKLEPKIYATDTHNRTVRKSVEGQIRPRRVQRQQHGTHPGDRRGL